MASSLVKLSLLFLCLYSATTLVHGRSPVRICRGGPRGQNCNIACLVADPVCGADGVTYGCGCPEADCKGVRAVKKGPCDSPPPQPADACGNTGGGAVEVPSPSCDIRCFRYDPVCGVNGVTYGCGCPEATCKGVRVIKLGEC